MRRAVEQQLLTLRQIGVEFRVPVRSSVTVQVVQANAPSWETLVFDGIDDVDVVKVTVAFGTVDIVARGRGTGATCPDCGHHSERTHGSYQRRLRDLRLGELASDGSARASLRCAGTRAGTARITATAKAPDVAGAARVTFTLDVNVVPYTTQG